jgi:transposase
MMLIGIDPHKSTHTATAIAPDANHEVASIRIDATLGEYRRMLTWARQWPQRRWAVENAEVLAATSRRGCSPAAKTSSTRPRLRPRGCASFRAAAGRMNDRIDAGAACVAALQGDARPLQAEGYADAMAVFDERRVNLAQCRVRAVNQLHALLRALIASGAPRDLSATTEAALLHTIRPHGAVEQAREAVAKDLVSEIRTLDRQLKANAQAIARLVATAGIPSPKLSAWGPSWLAVDQSDRSRQPFPHRLSFRQLRRSGPGRDCQRGEVLALSLTPRGSATQLRPSHHCDHPDPHVGQPRQPLLANQDRRGKDITRGRALPEETPRRPPLARHDHRRRTAGGEPGRTSGGGSAIQSGWLNPNNQLFGQVTPQTRQPRLYDDQASRLTNTEAPKGTDLSIHSAQDLDWVAELNDRPRKRLRFRKAGEQIADLLLAA